MEHLEQDDLQRAIRVALEQKQQSIEAIAGIMADVRNAQAELDRVTAEWSRRYEAALSVGWNEKELNRLGLMPPTSKPKRRRTSRKKTGLTSQGEPVINQE